MRLPTDAQVAGMPVQAAQQALRSIARRAPVARATWVHLQHALRRRRRQGGTPPTHGPEETWDALAAAGLLEESEVPDAWTLSPQGADLCEATLGPGFRRPTAERALAAFVERCRALEAPDAPFSYRVAAAVLCGEHAAGRERVGSVELLVWLVPRSPPPPAGERFWGYRQAWLHLRGGNRILALRGLDQARLDAAMRGPHRLVFTGAGLRDLLGRGPAWAQGSSTALTGEPSAPSMRSGSATRV